MLADVDTAPIDDKLRGTLKLLRTLTKDHTVTPADIETVLALGVTKKQVEDAFAVCFAFNVIDRIADTFEFHVGPRAHFDIGAKMLLTRGYR